MYPISNPSCSFKTMRLKTIWLRVPALAMLLLLLVHMKSNAQAFQNYYDSYSAVQAPTGILLNKGFIYRKQIQPFLNTANPRVFISNSWLWKQHYGMLKKSITNPDLNWPELTDFYTEPEQSNPEVIIGGFYVDGDYIDHNIIHQYYNTNTKKIHPNAPLDTVTMASVVNLRSFVKTNAVSFRFDTLNFFTNRPKSDVLGLILDLDDGQGEVYYPFGNFEVQVNYSSLDIKKLLFKLVTTTGTIATYSTLTIVPDGSFTHTEFKPLVTTLPGGGIKEGLYSIDLSCDGVLDKPFIIVEGFDPLNKIDSIDSQQKYFEAGLLSYLLEYGYDIIGLQFKDNNDSLQNNAQVVKKLIETLNQEKQGHFENIIIGESNGGLNSRIALAEMEAQNIDHEVGLYISFDSPQAGANIPLGIQEFGFDSQNLDFSFFLGMGLDAIVSILQLHVNFAGAPSGGIQNLVDDHLGDEIIKTINANDSPAARQQLIRHRDPNYLNTILNPEYEFFQQFLKQVGYPEDCRKITLINGSNTAEKQDSDFKERMMDLADIDVWVLFDAQAYALISPINEPYWKVSAIESSALLWDIIDEEGVFSFSTPKPYDLAPGGIIKNEKIIKDCAFSFTASTIDLDESVKNASYGSDITDDGLFRFKENSDDPKRRRRYIVEQGLTPFDDIYANGINSGHISLLEIENLVRQIDLREFMLEKLYLQNRIFVNGRVRQFHATTLVQTGRTVNQVFPEKLINETEFVVKAGADVTLTAGDYILLSPGTEIEHGGTFCASIKSDSADCKSFFSGGPKVFKKIVPIPVIEKEYTKDLKQTTFRVKNPFEDASAADYQWILVGNGFKGNYTGFSFAVTDLPIGNYCVVCSLFDGERKTTKFFEIKEDASDNTVELRESPLELQAYRVANHVKLHGKARELPNHQAFVVERQQSNQEWALLTSVYNTGSSDELSYFEVIDSHPLPGYNFYRLRWTLPDGKYAYSAVQNVWFPIFGDISISPNPASERLTVDFVGIENGNGVIFITDPMGRKVWQTEKSDSPQLDIPLGGLNDGVYFITYSNEGVPPISKRFIVVQK